MRAHYFARFGGSIPTSYQTNSKVRNPNIVTLAGEKDVLRFDIPMNDAGGVSRPKSIRCLPSDVQDRLYGPGVEAEPIPIA